MMKKTMRLICLIMAVCMLAALYVPVQAAKADYITDIGFDDCETGLLYPGISIDGTENARVVEHSVRNKSLYIPASFRDSTVNIPLDSAVSADSYFISFDIKLEGTSPDVSVSLKNDAGTLTEILTSKAKGGAYNAKGKHIGYITKNKFMNIAVHIDNETSCYSLYMDGSPKINRWSFTKDYKAAALQIALTSTKSEGSGVYIDNVRCYKGYEYVNEKRSYDYNPDEFPFEEVDESKVSTKVYFNKDVEDITNPGYNKLTNFNAIDAVYDEAEQNGYTYFDFKTDKTAYIDHAVSKTGTNFVMEVDVRHEGNPCPNNLFNLIDRVSSSSMLQVIPASITSSGAISSGGTSYPLKKGRWYTVSVAMDMSKHLYSTYVNGELLVKDKSFAASFKQLTTWRMYTAPGASLGVLKFDNYKLYDGLEPRDISSEDVSVESTLITNDNGEKYLKGKTALNGYSSKIYYKNTKQDMDIPAVNIKDEMLVSKDTIEKVFGVKVQVSGSKITIGTDVTMELGSTTMYADRIPVEMDYAPFEKDGNVYIPSVAYAEHGYKDKNVYNDNKGMILVSRDVIQDSDPLQEARLYMYFTRDSVATLTEKFDKATGEGSMHPRVVATADDFARLREDIKTSPAKKLWFDKIKAYADKLLSGKPQVYEIINDRLLHVGQNDYDRLPALAMCYQVTGEDKYAAKVYEELKALAEFPDWYPQQALGIGEMSGAAAIGYDWIYDYMTPDQREYIAKAFIKHSLDPIWDSYTGNTVHNTFWLKINNNWNSNVHGGVSALAFAIAEYDKEYCMKIIESAFRGMEYMWDEVAPSGAWNEGPGYWKGAVRFMGIIGSTATNSLGEPFEFDYYKGMLGMASFPMYYSDPKMLCNNYHDAGTDSRTDANTFYYADLFDEPGIGVWYRNYLVDYDVNVGNHNLHTLDLLWYNADWDKYTTPTQLPLDSHMSGLELVNMRESYGDPNALWISTHGGEHTTAHSHRDAGTYVFNLGGVRWAVDLGNDNYYYNSQSTSPAYLAGYNESYFYRRKGEGHNIVVINPDDKLEMTNKFVPITEPVSGVDEAYSYADLTPAYGDKVDKYLRGYKVSDGRRSFTLRDEIDLTAPSEMYWFMHTKGKITVLDNSTALIMQDGKTLKVQIITNAEKAELTVMDAVSLPTSPQFQNSANPNTTKLTLKLSGSGRVNITAKMSLANEPASLTPPQDIDIADWTADADNAYEYSYSKARIDNIYLNGKAMFGFKSDAYDYSSVLSEAGEMPAITCDSAYDTEIHTYTLPNGNRLAELRALEAPGVYTSYLIEFRNFVPDDYAAYDRHPVVSAEASSEQIASDPPHLKEYSYDGDFSADSRWSADGDGEWLIHDYGTVVEIDALATSFWNGGNRKYTYDIYISDDNVSYTKLITHTTTGTTEDMETVILDRRVTARYIKFVGHGNTVNTWNNLIEFAALRKK